MVQSYQLLVYRFVYSCIVLSFTITYFISAVLVICKAKVYTHKCYMHFACMGTLTSADKAQAYASICHE